MQKPTRKVAPDGGWGWVACFGVSLVNLATRAIEPSFGLLFGDLLLQLEVKTLGAAIIMSTYDVMMNFSGLFVGPLLKEFSYRKVAIAGSLLCSLGLALTSPASSMAHILMTYSVINGIGVGLATSAAFVALNHYFKNKRGQAVGLSMAGTALGMLILPQLVRILLDAFEFSGAILVLAGLALHAAFGSTLLQPIKWHLKDEVIDVEMAPQTEHMETVKEDEDELPEMKTLLFPPVNTNGRQMRKNFSEVAISSMNNGMAKRPTFPRIMSNGSNMAGNGVLSNGDISTSIRRRKASVMSQLSTLDFMGSNLLVHVNTGDEEAEEEDRAIQIRRVNTALGMSAHHEQNSFTKFRPSSLDGFKPQLDIGGIDITPTAKKGFFRRFIELMDVSLLKDPGYLNILFGLSIFYVAEMNFKMVTPFFFANLGYSKTDVAKCLSVTAISDIAARIVLPPICDRFDVKKRSIFFVSILFVGITRSIMAEQTDFNMLMMWLFICGFFRGMALSNFTLCVSEYCSLEQLPAAFGWHMIGKGLFVTAFGPLIGLIRDATDSYPICIHAQSFCIFLCCLAWSIEYILSYIRKHKDDDSEPKTTETMTATTNSTVTTPGNTK
ncbi:uncharacterized protein LOC116340468 [Contarinia nasturtii]|uniref:uncharacterized protein LOC116340468 n=1 Tax=Contarinia nasturtii TaxID=265458 RepID=UPI0012D45254|nr:uncharacterized protein LOC116340468 [Contarinia nasturtii]